MRPQRTTAPTVSANEEPASNIAIENDRGYAGTQANSGYCRDDRTFEHRLSTNIVETSAQNGARSETRDLKK